MRVAACLIVLATLGLVAPARAEDCPPPGGVDASGAQAVGPLSLRLGDGRLVKLAGLTVPDNAVADATLLLAERTAGQHLRFVPVFAQPDRYGRIVARAVIETAEGPVWLEAALVEAGLALANLAPGETQCLAALTAAEDRGRRERRGLWAADPGPIVAATEHDAISGLRGRFVLVEGRVFSVGVRDYATFLDFGRSWKEDLAAVIPKSERAKLEARVGPAQSLKGKLVRIRGFLDPEGAPRLRVTMAEAIEVLGDR